ncbi:MAG: toll/interleukin-1 receptor domain-containing protein [Bacteroidales bacterium]|nr:toll/interleukin-1 receptor domain-containing protein [Bacteroidales bacterium]
MSDRKHYSEESDRLTKVLDSRARKIRRSESLIVLSEEFPETKNIIEKILEYYFFESNMFEELATSITYLKLNNEIDSQKFKFWIHIIDIADEISWETKQSFGELIYKTFDIGEEFFNRLNRNLVEIEKAHNKFFENIKKNKQLLPKDTKTLLDKFLVKNNILDNNVKVESESVKNDSIELETKINNSNKNVNEKGPIKAFISYAHEDEDFRINLRKHLKSLERRNLIEVWDDREIVASDEWREEIKKALRNCQLALLLISIDFINSDFINDQELNEFLRKRKDEGLKIVPIIIRECDWKEEIFANLQATPKDGESISSYQNRDLAWVEVVNEIKRVLKNISETTSSIENTLNDSFSKTNIEHNKSVIPMETEKAHTKANLQAIEVRLLASFNTIKVLDAKFRRKEITPEFYFDKRKAYVEDNFSDFNEIIKILKETGASDFADVFERTINLDTTNKEQEVAIKEELILETEKAEDKGWIKNLKEKVSQHKGDIIDVAIKTAIAIGTALL